MHVENGAVCDSVGVKQKQGLRASEGTLPAPTDKTDFRRSYKNWPLIDVLDKRLNVRDLLIQLALVHDDGFTCHVGSPRRKH